MQFLILAVALSSPVPAALPGKPVADQAFYETAARGGMAEVELGNLAEQKATSQSVRQFGAMMVADHSAANEKLKSVASAKHIKLPTKPSLGERTTKAKLETLSGDAFDKAYVKDMIKDHEKDIKLFNQEATSGSDPDAKAFAAATLPTLQAHLDKIKMIAASAGIQAD